MKVLFVSWQDPIDRHWRPVGRLSFEDNHFTFVYTKGAKTAENFLPFGRMNDLNGAYVSRELFPFFSNRILSKSRPEYKEYLEWLDVPIGKDDPLALLALTGGIRGTDSIMIFPCPEPTSDGKYVVHFFSQGLRYLKDQALEIVGSLQPGTQLFLMLDVQNEFDEMAIALRTDKPPVFVGYAPRYFASDFRQLLSSSIRKSVKVLVERVNGSAPVQLRLLCSITSEWPKDFAPCSGELFEPLVPGFAELPLESKR
jgi:hypothetical protein